MPDQRSPFANALSHAWAIAIYIGLFCWVFAQLVFTDAYLAESDLQDWYLPVFLAPIARWPNELVAGFPVFADLYDTTLYPIHLLFARVIHSWAGYVISAYVLGASFMYAYVFTVTRSRTAGVFSGLAFSLSEAMVERQAHMNILHSLAWLPLIVLSLDRLVAGGSRRWVAIGACAVACCLIGGHPQTLLYVGSLCFVYTVAGGWATRAPKAVYIRAVAMVVLGVLLTAVKSFPFLEATRYAARDVVSFERFLTSSHTPMQLLGVLFPAIQHNGREAPLYVGLAVLPLAVLGVTSHLKWRARVWAGAAIFAFLVSAGNLTPVARIAYELPLFDWFRVGSRILVVFAAASAALAGFGLAAIQQRAPSRTATWLSVSAMLLALGVGALLLAVMPERVAFVGSGSAGWNLPVWPESVWVQLAFGIASAAGILWLSIGSRFGLSVAAVSVLLAADLLQSLPYPVTPTGLILNVIPGKDLGPSVHAIRLAEQIEPARQRLLAYGGSTADPLVPPGFARLWHIPIAGAYTQLLPGWLVDLTAMGTSGDIKPETLAIENRALDLLAVRFVTIRSGDIREEPTFERGGITWSQAPLDFPVGRADCGKLHPRAVSLPLPPDDEISSVAMLAHLRCADQVPQGAEAGRIEIVGPAGVVYSKPLIVGVDLSERDLSDPATRERAQHKPAALFDDPFLQANQSLVRIHLPQPVRGGRLVLHGAAMNGWTSLERLTFIGTSGRNLPQRLAPLIISDPEHWREAARFRTSRVTDREMDESSPDEHEVVVYENRRVLPRVWVAPNVVELGEADIQAAVRHSTLPDGQPFDPLRLALVESDDAPAMPPVNQSASSEATARVTSIEDGRIAVDVSTSAGGFLVLGEMYYPGWRARVGERVVAVRRTDGMLQGVSVPAGQHTVVFELISWSLRVGAAVTLAASLVALLLLWRG